MTFGPANRNLKDTITYWAQLTSVNDFGARGWAAPVLMKGRWLVADKEAVNKNGEQIISTAQVAINGIVAVEGYLAHGDYSGSSDPTQVVGAREIQAFQSTPDLRLMEQRNLAFL